jgi:nucleoside-diphosphate-sugar epimerase
MAGDLVLLTGSTGYLGYLVLIDLLKHGYRVRAAVRSQDKANKLRAAPSLSHLAPTGEQLEFVFVPDMTAPNAYDEAVKGVTYIMHVASPIPTFGDKAPTKKEDYEEVFVNTARRGTLGILQAAREKAGGTVKKVVLTSSVTAVTPPDAEVVPDEVIAADHRVPVPKTPYASEQTAYSASKIASLEASDKWIRENRPAFDVISVLPAWIFGHDELITDAAAMRVGGTNSMLLHMITGGRSELMSKGGAVYGPDAARVHVAALGSELEGNHAFMASVPIVWQDAVEIARKYFPDAFADGRLKEGSRPTRKIGWDATKVCYSGTRLRCLHMTELDANVDACCRQERCWELSSTPSRRWSRAWESATSSCSRRRERRSVGLQLAARVLAVT